MKKFFRFLMFLGVVTGVAMVVKQLIGGEEGQSATTGVLPEKPVTPLEEAPLGGDISPDLLKILVDPQDKGPLELVDDGKFLLNPRNGYKYPIRNGIPVMLIEEGKKYRDPSLIRANGGGNAAEEAAKA
jgi:uncharacterized protein YbaR (Trm112 family)